MTEYLVMWEIDVDADTAETAAVEAHRLVRTPDTTATIYKVIRKGHVFNDPFIEVDVAEVARRRYCENCDQPFDPELCSACQVGRDVESPDGGDPISGKGMVAIPDACGPCCNAERAQYGPRFIVECDCARCQPKEAAQ